MVKAGTFDLNNLLSRFNFQFQDAIDAIQGFGGSARLIHRMIVIVSSFAVPVLLSAAVVGFAEQENPEVLRATIEGIGEVSPERCKFESPCPGLKRGATLRVRLDSTGYAAAYLRDKGGYYFNQEGRLFIEDDPVGETKLWPGTESRIAHPKFGLYIITSRERLARHPDDKGLKKEELPPGHRWGPVYLLVE